MLKTLMVGLDGSDDAVPALDLGLRWARAHDALLVGCGVVDVPGIELSEATVYAEGYGFAGPIDQGLVAEATGRVESTLERFARLCRAEGVRCEAIEEAGTPCEELLAEAQRFDLLLLGRRTHFAFGWPRRGDATLKRALRESARPVVVVPDVGPGDDAPVVVAFDGEAPSARALAAFEATGLGRGRALHVATAGRDREAAEALADRAVDFLRHHDLDARPRAVADGGPPAEFVLREARRLDAGLIVMGACGRSPLRELFGSTTRAVLERSQVPVFCVH
jgi:nucleotide-binding universal stress UspA family protein